MGRSDKDASFLNEDTMEDSNLDSEDSDFGCESHSDFDSELSD